MRIKRLIDQKEQEKKLRMLDKAQEAAREAAEIAVLEEEDERRAEEDRDEKKRKGTKISKSLLEMETTQMFGGKAIKEKKETDLESEARKEAKKKDFYENFKPDFDLDEVPDLE
jgi:hypothetical protein